MYVCLSDCHGNPYLNDVITSYITETLRDLLLDSGYEVKTHINVGPRSTVDLNRPQGRSATYRKLLRETLKEHPDFLLDIHSYPTDSLSPMRDYDIVVLRSYREGQAEFAEGYYKILKQVAGKEFRIGCLDASQENDIVKEALEFRVPAVLVEHAEDGPVGAFAKLHFEVIKRLEKVL